MSLSALTDGTRSPTQDQLRSVLGRAYAPWVRLLELVAQRIEAATPGWRFSTGWSLRVLHRQRVILYMTPQKDQFLVSLALGERAVAAAHAAKLAPSVLQVVDAAPQYAEGRGVRFCVRGSRQLPALARLAEIKREN